MFTLTEKSTAKRKRRHDEVIMNDTLATINVDQLSSAVNAVVQSTAIGQVPLDPSPPPDAAPPSLQEGGSLTLPGGGGAPPMVLPSASQVGRLARGRTLVSVPKEINIPGTALHSTQTAPTSGPVVLVPSTGGQIGQRGALPQHNTLNIQPQIPAKKLYTLRQIGSNWVLVPTSSQNVPAPALISSPSLLQPVPGSLEPVVYQPSSLPGPNINSAQALCSQSRQQPSQINMNIAIQLPNNATTPPMSGVNQLHGCGLHPAQPPNQPSHLLSHICNLITSSTASPSKIIQPTQINPPPQFMIVPNQSGSTPLQGHPLTSQVTSVPSQFGLLTPGQSGQSEALPMTSSTTITAPSVLTNSISNINLFSPPLNFASQSQMLSPLTSQKGCHDNSSFSGFTNPLDLQPVLLNQGPDLLSIQPQQVSPGFVKLSSLPSLISPPREMSKVMDSTTAVKRVRMVQQNRKESVRKQQDSWCGPGKSAVKGCPHQKPSVVVVDKAVETRARQSLPDLLTFKPSTVIPGETGVFAKQEIQANTRFGPVVGKLADINSSTDLDAIGQKAWRIFSDGKLCQLLFTNDESCSNWMMFIKMSKNHNLMAFQSGAHIYFTSFQNILPGEELIVWYSKEYGRLRGIKEKRRSSLECQKCRRRFTDRTQLGRHLKEDHSSPRCPEERHKCDVCSHMFPSSSKLRNHLLTHLGVKPHRCKVCHKGFTDRSNLRAHSLIHTGAKEFTCQTCNKSFRQKVHLTSHQVTHTGRRDLQCCVCHKMFARSSDLSYHMKQHREVKKVSCPVCDIRFYKDSQLMRHMKIHSGQRDHQCHLCGKGFITKYHLSRHLKSCERYERFRRKPWPGSNSLESMGGVVSSTSDERLLVRPVAPNTDDEQQVYMPSRRRPKRREVQESSSSRVLRSSRGRPIRPKPVPAYMAQFVSPPSRGQGSSKRKKQMPRKVSHDSDDTPKSGSMATHTVSVTLYEVQSGSVQEIRQAISQPSPSLSQLVHRSMSEGTKETMASGHSASMSVYGAQGDETEGNTDPGADQQQPCSTLSQLAIAVPQESPIVLDCDTFVSSSSVSQSHLETSYAYSSSDPQGDDEIHDSSLTTPLFDLGEGPSMSSAAQSISAYNSQSFSLEEEDDDNHSDAFAGSQEHCSSARSLFMTDATMSDPVASSSSQSLTHQTHVDSLADDNHSDAFAGSREHCASSQSLFMTDSAMSDSVASTSAQSLGHQAHGNSLTEDSLFSIDPADESGTSLPQHTGDSMDDISVDLRAIERALDSDDDEEQCTDERRGDSPSANIEE